MCLTIPKKIVTVKRDYIEVCRSGSSKKEKVGSILEVKKGDWVLTQNNIIINKITKGQASQINKIFNKK